MFYPGREVHLKIGALFKIWHDFRTSSRWRLIRLLPEVSLILTIALVVCVLLNALLPTAFILVTGFLLEVVRGAGKEGFTAGVNQEIVFGLVLLSSLFITQQIFGSLRG